MSGWLAVSAFFASAPIDTPRGVSTIFTRSRRVTSMSSVGRSTSSFIRSRMFVPPARNRDCGLAAAAETAAPGSAARTYLNGLIVVLPSDARELLLGRVSPRLRRALAGVELLDRRDDPRVRSA